MRRRYPRRTSHEPLTYDADRRWCPLRRCPHRDAARPEGPPRPSRRSGALPERHPVHPRHPRSGCRRARPWGLLDEVDRDGLPADRDYTFDFGPFVDLRAPHRPVDGSSTAYAPRRTLLDTILVDAAARAGVEVRSDYIVEEILDEAGIVAGIRGHLDGEPSPIERARVVVGADGWNSMVATARRRRAVQHQAGARERVLHVLERPASRRFTTILRGDRGIAAIPTNDDLTLVLVGCPSPRRASSAATSRATTSGRSTLPRVRRTSSRGRRVEPFTGGGVPNFFRVPYGPGWALVGDAGYTKDPVTAQGISDAFRSAERCAAALDEAFTGVRSFDDAMGDYQQATRRRRPSRSTSSPPSSPRWNPRRPPMQELLAATARQPGRDGRLRQRHRRHPVAGRLLGSGQHRRDHERRGRGVTAKKFVRIHAPAPRLGHEDAQRHQSSEPSGRRSTPTRSLHGTRPQTGGGRRHRPPPGRSARGEPSLGAAMDDCSRRTLGTSAGCVSAVPAEDPINRDDSFSACVAALGDMPDAVEPAHRPLPSGRRRRRLPPLTLLPQEAVRPWWASSDPPGLRRVPGRGYLERHH